MGRIILPDVCYKSNCVGESSNRESLQAPPPSLIQAASRLSRGGDGVVFAEDMIAEFLCGRLAFVVADYASSHQNVAWNSQVKFSSISMKP